MGKIRILSEEVANRIAAGEVVERPASVAKELIENAIDAKADKIFVDIKNGGKSYLKITDNGHGMTEEDALLSLERHATSKIRTINDIEQIMTLGFRGEAIPSIASVSKMSIITKTENDELATKISIDSGIIKNVTKIAGNTGTTITIQKLFSNVPARKKFLKSAQVEYRHILNYIHYQSILFPYIHFRFISSDREKLNYPPVENLKKRLISVFGNTLFKNDFISIKKETKQLLVHGYIAGLEEIENKFHDLRYIFVNGRFIKDKIIWAALKKAYEPYIQKLNYFKKKTLPPFILFIEIDPGLVDFNVHPAKLEIRFRDSHLMYNFIKDSTSNALSEYENEKFKSLKSKISHTGSEPITKLESSIYKNEFASTKKKGDKKEVDSSQPDLFFQEEKNSDSEESGSTQKNDLFLSNEEDLINPWQLHQSYILVQVEEGLMMIDQHAAHERIIYEKIINRIDGEPPVTQTLLFPLIIDIPPYISSLITDLIEDNLKTFKKIGFSLKKFSGDSIVINEIPQELEDWYGGEVFIDILKQLQVEFENTENFRVSLAKSIACKAALKAGKKMIKKEMVKLINDLFACEDPYFCPHGRPLIFNITLDEIEKRFKRT